MSIALGLDAPLFDFIVKLFFLCVVTRRTFGCGDPLSADVAFIFKLVFEFGLLEHLLGSLRDDFTLFSNTHFFKISEPKAELFVDMT